MELRGVAGVRVTDEEARPEDRERTARLPGPARQQPFSEPLAALIGRLESGRAAMEDLPDVPRQRAAHVRGADGVDPANATSIRPLQQATRADDIGVGRLAVSVGKKLKARGTGKNFTDAGRALLRQPVRQRSFDEVDLARLHGAREVDFEGLHEPGQPIEGVAKRRPEHHYDAAIAVQQLAQHELTEKAGRAGHEDGGVGCGDHGVDGLASEVCTAAASSLSFV